MWVRSSHPTNLSLPSNLFESAIAVDSIVVAATGEVALNRNRVQCQLLQQRKNLIIVPDFVPRESEVFLMFLKSVYVPMKIAGLYPLGLVAKVLQNRLL